MKKKLILIVLILAILVPTTLMAASRGGVGLVNYALLESYVDSDTAAYVPGLRLEFFFNKYLGISGDAMLLASSPDDDIYIMMYVVDAVLRGPFGMIEPYIALGPAYLGWIVDGEADFLEDSLGFNVRAGLDVNRATSVVLFLSFVVLSPYGALCPYFYWGRVPRTPRSLPFTPLLFCVCCRQWNRESSHLSHSN